MRSTGAILLSALALGEPFQAQTPQAPATQDAAPATAAPDAQAARRRRFRSPRRLAR